jgi:NAD(P)-dependent dehydrogenase (short-subunit alcohol dehydrogenase family)
MESILSKIPMGRFATGEDITGAAIFLASEASDFITGQTIFVDGGWNAAR